MAKKATALKFATEIREQIAVTNRHPAAEMAALYLLQVRVPRLKISPLKKKLIVVMDPETRAQIAHPVKIRHVG